jgi:hypothetical protein
MVITWKKLGSIQFPIFALPSSNWEEQDGLLYIDNRVVDDRNMSGKTLGRRRLQTPIKDLLPLRGSIAAPVSLIRQTRIKTFIDSAGTPFIYKSSLSKMGSFIRFLDGSDDYLTSYLKMLVFVVIVSVLGLIFWYSHLLRTLTF